MSVPTIAPHKKFDGSLYFDLAREICREVEHKDKLTADEVIVLSVVAAQLALRKYIEPGYRDTEATLNKILTLLDDRELVKALDNKMHLMLMDPHGVTGRLSKASTAALEILKDEEEPADDFRKTSHGI